MKTSLTISIAFVGGIIFIAQLAPNADIGIAELSLCTAVASLTYASQSGQNRIALMLAAFCAGTFACATANISITAEHSLPPLVAKIHLALQRHIDRQQFAQQTSALIHALLMGERSELEPGVVESFRAAGASHILALSGLHMGIIYSVLSAILSPLGSNRVALWIKSILGVTFTGFYTIMTGASASVIRAFIFICIHSIARLCPSRKSYSINILSAAAIIQLSIDPLQIRQLGFQLSYLAMLAISTIFPKINAWYPESQGFHPMKKLWTAAALSISCQLFTAPLVFLKMGTFPRYFLISNLIGLPLTEAFIISTTIELGLSAIGIELEITKSLVEKLGQALVYCLEIIASL